ncbi:GUN4 domain-containing protein [Microbispora hainanensis]|uniref:GUN4 domain-containing protein n=1 Tax=Microbispora hainanensis TaxID=568844 RepID=UPI002E27C1D1|nr:GUN4 domain-containing protein [Microbispora hainanensis]
MSRDLIFISFRNGDGDVLADHIDGELRRQFGDDNVFRSGRSIPPGMAFDKVLYDALNRACVLLVIIGPRWAGVTDSGGRRIDVPGDWVRTEVALSLAAGIRVIPILLNNTPLPTAEQLPDDLKELSKRQTIPYRTKFGHRDCAHLVDELREIYEITRVQPQSGPVQLPSGTSRRLNFQVLDDLLASRRWEEADRETASLLWAAAGGDPNTSRAHLIEPDQVDGLARDDVRSIDLLWRHRSDGRFGFTPQRDALRQAAGDLIAYGSAVGWRTNRWIFYAEAQFSLGAPRGHLPILGPIGGIRPPWKLRQIRDGYGSMGRLPIDLARYLRDPTWAEQVHARPVDESFGWQEYSEMASLAMFEVYADAAKLQGRRLRKILTEAPARRMFANYTQLISVVWAINRPRLLDRLGG